MQHKNRLSAADIKRLALTQTEKRDLHDALRAVLKDAFGLEDVAELQLSILVDALMDPLAKVYYNKGVADARHIMSERLDDVASIQF